jgi:hypothetical protein
MRMADSPAVRRRRHRARWKAGLGVVSAEIDWFAVTELLIRAGLLAVRDIDNRRAVGIALSAWIASHA